MSAGTTTCEHVAETRDVTPLSNGCDECLAEGNSWVELRLCMTCGNVGCCDSSKSRHATAHHMATGHPIATPFDIGEDWGWCYIDQIVLQPFSALRTG